MNAITGNTAIKPNIIKKDVTISLITITYNSAKTVRTTFESVLAQTYKDIDYWVIDGGSKDDTLNIIKEYEEKFDGRMHWISEPDKGIYDAMNKGIMRSTGDIVGILNSDDLFFDNTVLETIKNAFENTATECVFANLVYVSEHDINKITRVWKGTPYKEGKFKYGWGPAHPTFYTKRECYMKYGLYNLSYQVSADFELLIRYLGKYKIQSLYIDKYFVKMREGGESNKSIGNIFRGNKNILRAFKENGQERSIFYPFLRLIPKILMKVKIKTLNTFDREIKL